MWSAVQTRRRFPGASLSLATGISVGAGLSMAAGLLCALQAPAAAFEWTVPASYHALSVQSGTENHELMGLQMPVLWVGGPVGPFALHFAGGYAYQREKALGDHFNFVTVQADLDWELPFPIVVPYVGVEAMGWYPIDPKGYLQGIPVMAAPHAGVRFSLADIVSIDLWAFGYPAIPGVFNLTATPNVWNVSNSAGQPYTGTSWGAGGRIGLNL